MAEEYNGMRGWQAFQAKAADARIAEENKAILAKLRANEALAAEPAPQPVSNAPAVAAPSQGPTAPPSASMPNQGVPTGTTPADPTSYWSSKAPQLQVGVTDPAPSMQYDLSHLQKQPLQSAAEKFGGATETSRALRSGIGQRYSGGGQNG